MKTQTKILIDRLVGLPLAWTLNGLARVLGLVLRRDHTITPENVRTIVISKYLGMGSILQATPLIRSVRMAFPRARLIFVTGQSCRRMVERLEHIDRIITVDDRGLLRVASTSTLAIAKLIGSKVDLYFDLEIYSAYSSLMALLSLARNRIGFYRESAQHKRGNYTHLMFFNTRHPIRHIYLQLGRLVGCEPIEPDRLGPIRIEPRDREEVAARLKSLGPGASRYLVINPNASDLMVERRWPAERFAKLIDRLVAQCDLSVILIGAPDDRAHVNLVMEQVSKGGDRILNLAGELSLGGLFALLKGAMCVVTNDTGPMHMAWALEVPTVSLFGPGDPKHYGWDGPGVELLYKQVYCSPCLYQVDLPPCNGNNVCMKLITVDEVFDAVERILAGVSVRPRLGLDPGFFSDQHSQPLGRITRGAL
ncbi:MAG: glycosyltransferase family 9 protein [Planctomycetaceae bacterium]|nr:glycosyltransferase family 9 protein [Planctomycetaceae bacterium]